MRILNTMHASMKAYIKVVWSPGYGPPSLAEEDVARFQGVAIKTLDKAAIEITTSDHRRLIIPTYHVAAIVIKEDNGDG